MKRWMWAVWAGAIIISFAVFEGYALMQPDGVTLSQAVVDLSHAWPPIVFLLGMLVGGLVAHFWWFWVPRQRREVCSICMRTTLIDR